ETLKKNNLVEYETIADITARFVVNRVSMKVKAEEIKQLIEKLRKVRKK
ncbi:MAG: ATP phosphoribosyltransferase, partial [Thermodesulfobacteriota bacterium]